MRRKRENKKILEGQDKNVSLTEVSRHYLVFEKKKEVSDKKFLI